MIRVLAVIAMLMPTAAFADPLTDELVRLENARIVAYVAGDRETLERHFAAEYNHTNLSGGLTNREEELDFYAPGRFRLGSGRISDVTVHDYGEIATLLGTITWENAVYSPSPDVAVDLSGHFRVTRVYVHRDGRWQLAASHASRIGGPPPTD